MGNYDGSFFNQGLNVVLGGTVAPKTPKPQAFK
jgi:hypothetical protein